jgi:predicted nucleotidyltransferase
VPWGAHRKGHSDVPTGRRIGFRDQPAQLQQKGFMTIAPAPPIEQRLLGMAAAIRLLIPAAEVRLFGSRARGEAGPDYDVDLLITAPDGWLASGDRFALLADLWGAVAQPDLSVDLVLHSSSEAARRAQQPGSLAQEAIREWGGARCPPLRPSGS